jgi:hypothetical protein
MLHLAFEVRNGAPKRASLCVQTPHGVLQMYGEGLRGAIRLKLHARDIEDLPLEFYPLPGGRAPAVIEWFLKHEGTHPPLSLQPDMAVIRLALGITTKLDRDAMYYSHRERGL